MPESLLGQLKILNVDGMEVCVRKMSNMGPMFEEAVVSPLYFIKSSRMADIVFFGFQTPDGRIGRRMKQRHVNFF